MPPSLRPYQEQAIKEILNAWSQGYKAPLLNFATGLGKTAVCCTLLKRSINLDVQRVLILVDRQELVRQFHANLIRWWAEIDSKWSIHDRPGRGMVMNVQNDVAARVVVATSQSLALGGSDDDENYSFDVSRTEEILQFGSIDLLVLDEVHSAVNWRTRAVRNKLLEFNPGLRTLGMTATSRREDGVSLREIGLDCSVTPRNIRWGIENGYLAPCGGAFQFTSEVAGSGRKFKVGKLANNFELMLDAWNEHGADRKTLWFMSSVQEAREFHEFLIAAGYPAAHVDSELCIDWDGQVRTDKYARESIINAYKSNPKNLQLVNYDVFSTGVDIESISCICINRPTDSQVWITQSVGRATRLCEDKENWVVLDFATKQLELFMAENELDLLSGYDLRARSAPVEDEEEKGEEDVNDPDQLEEGEVLTGSGVIVREVDLFKNMLGGSWHRDEHMQYSLQLSTDLALVVTPPDPLRAEKIKALIDSNPEYQNDLLPLWEFRMSYALWVVKLEERTSRNGRKYRTPIVNEYPEFQSQYLDLVLDAARPFKVNYGDPKMFRPSSSWRKRSSASDGQLRFLRTLGYNGTVKDSDAAGRLITHYLCVPVVADRIRDMMLLATELYREAREESVA